MVCHQAELSLRPSTKGFVIGLVLKAVQLHFSGTKKSFAPKICCARVVQPPKPHQDRRLYHGVLWL